LQTEEENSEKKYDFGPLKAAESSSMRSLRGRFSVNCYQVYKNKVERIEVKKCFVASNKPMKLKI
jgi:hypothetical protein